jgi:sterol desaturase/sphingolipid hydroxylase (fatty acid hydroxylase superfamily)
MKRIPAWLSSTLVLAELGILLWNEWKRPLRSNTEDKVTRFARNGVIAGLAVIPAALIETPVATRLASEASARGWGIIPRLGLPKLAQTVVAIALMDYTMFVWHAMTHRVPFLWRFHIVHHVDRDLDVSTALRFHCCEILVSVPWRAAQVLAIGLTPSDFSMWQLFLLLSVLFHHSNVRLPNELESSPTSAVNSVRSS